MPSGPECDSSRHCVSTSTNRIAHVSNSVTFDTVFSRSESRFAPGGFQRSIYVDQNLRPAPLSLQGLESHGGRYQGIVRPDRLAMTFCVGLAGLHGAGAGGEEARTDAFGDDL